MAQDTYRFYLLEKDASSYTYFGMTEVMGLATDPVKVIEDAARKKIEEGRGVYSIANITVDVLEPKKPIVAESDELGEKLEQTFSDDYRKTCRSCTTLDNLGAMDPNLREHLILVFRARVEFHFVLFQAGKYFCEGHVSLELDETVRAVMAAARDRIQDLNKKIREPIITSVMKSNVPFLGKSTGDLRGYYRNIDADQREIALLRPGMPLRELSTNNFFIEFVPHYISALFEKTGSSYTYLGYRNVTISQTDTLVGTIIDDTKANVFEIRQHQILGIYQFRDERNDSIDQIRGKFREEAPLDEKNIDIYHRGNSLEELNGHVLTIVTVYQGDENPIQSLSSIKEEPDTNRWEIAEAARKRKSPSEDAKPAVLRSTQRSTNVDAVRNERPMYLSGPPIQIYHPVFGKFLSLASMPFDGDEETLRKTSEFIEASRRLYDNEDTRLKTLKPYLGTLVHLYASRQTTHMIDGGKKFAPHATIFSESPQESVSPVCAFLEVKNEVGTGSCDPALQCQSDFVKLCSSSDYRPILDASCCPIFLLAIAGPRLLVTGAVFANTFIAQELTDYITLGSHPTDPDRGLRRVAQVLAALRECISDLSHFYDDLKFSKAPQKAPPVRGSRFSQPQLADTSQYVPERPLGKWAFPHYTEFGTNGEHFSLTYECPLSVGERTTRALFKASMKSSPESVAQSVVVKFTRRYCADAHRLLADMSLAPKLFYHEHSAGIHIIVMEYLEVTGDTEDQLNNEKGTKHVELLRRAVRALHGKKLVFGDLREPNILITKDGLRLVDFDWSGEEGTVRYPVGISQDIEWPDGVEGEEKIKREHDEVWFRQLTKTDL